MADDPTDNDVRPAQPSVDPEVTAIGVVLRALAPFDQKERTRIIAYAWSYYGLDKTATRSK
jgi:hypothetical protein